MPQEKGIPRRIELRRDTIQDNLSVAPKPSFYGFYYIACAVTSNTTNPLNRDISQHKGSAITSKTDPYGSLRGNRTPSFAIRILLNLSISRSLMPTLS